MLVVVSIGVAVGVRLGLTVALRLELPLMLATLLLPLLESIRVVVALLLGVPEREIPGVVEWVSRRVDVAVSVGETASREVEAVADRVIVAVRHSPLMPEKGKHGPRQHKPVILMVPS